MARPLLRPDLLGLGLILALGAVLRFGWPGVNSFGYDEARLSLIALAMARGGEFAALGMPSSAGVPNLPAAAWLFALPYALSTDPLVASAFVGLLSLGAVAAVWALARHAWGGWAAAAAALYLAASPFAVLYARSVWAQNFLPVLAALWLVSAYAAVVEGRRWAVALNLFVAGFAFQVHFAGAALAPASLYCLLRFRLWRFRWAAMLGGGLALILLLPFVFRLTGDAALLEQFRGALGGTPSVDLDSFGELARLALADDWGYLAAGSGTPALIAIIAVPLGLGLLALARLVGRGRADIDRRGAILAELTWVALLAPPLFFVRHSTPVFIHYLLTALPALALLTGASVLLVRRTWFARAVILGVTAAAGLWTSALWTSLDMAGHTYQAGGLSTPLAVTQSAAQAVADDRPVVFFTHGGDPLLDGEAAVFAALWWGREARIVNGESLLILPPAPATLMATLAPFQAWEELAAAGLAEAAQTLPRRAGEGEPFVMTPYDGQHDPQGYTPVDPPRRFADGAQLEGWRVRQVGDRLRISTLWRVLERPPAATLQQFHHLHAAERPGDDPLAVSDVPISAHTWQVGDRLVVMADFVDLPAGEYVVDIGHYTLPDLTRMGLGDGGDSVRLGLFTWAPRA